MEQRANHPLDIDLLAFALGELDVTPAADLDRHLGSCLLCRIHLNRIRRGGLDLGPDAVPTLSYPEIPPTVLGIAEGDRRPASVEAGQMWLAGTSDRMLLWVQAVNSEARMATVLAATLDVEAADHTSLIVAVPELDRNVAIFTSVPGWIPIACLSGFVAAVDIGEQIDQLSETLEWPVEVPAAGATDAAVTPSRRGGRGKVVAPKVGKRIPGGSDERLEFRQMLADQLAALYPEDDGEAEGDDGRLDDLSEVDAILADMRRALSEDLMSNRPGLCEIRALDELLVGSFANTLPIRPVAAVHELDCTMLIFATESHDEGFGFEPEHAYKLLLDSGASSLAVAEPVQPYPTRVFVRSVLRPAYEIPQATERVDPRPLWDSRPLVQAVTDFLQGDVFPIESETVALTPTHPDLVDFLPSQAQAAIQELKQIRAQKGKLRALKGLNPDDADALHQALTTSADLDELVARIEEITLR